MSTYHHHTDIATTLHLLCCSLFIWVCIDHNVMLTSSQWPCNTMSKTHIYSNIINFPSVIWPAWGFKLVVWTLTFSGFVSGVIFSQFVFKWGLKVHQYCWCFTPLWYSGGVCTAGQIQCIKTWCCGLSVAPWIFEGILVNCMQEELFGWIYFTALHVTTWLVKFQE